MDPWIAKGVFLAGMAVFVAIRSPHIRRGRGVRVVERRSGALERALLVLMMVGFFVLPVVCLATPVLGLADYPVVPGMFWGGVGCLLLSFWVFHRSHADLGTNWSRTLELRENHRLVTRGVYRSIRHPMYTGIYLYAVAQGLLLPNWIAGPACFAAFTVMFACRLCAEERMMVDRFGEDYERYRGRTKRLVPWVW